MKLVSDWRRVTLISLSWWMQAAGLLVLIAPEVRFAWTGRDYDPILSWWLGVLLLLAGLGGRILRQSGSRWREWARLAGVVLVVFALALLLAGKVRAAEQSTVPVSEAATLEVAVPFIAREEGMRLTAYRDIVGVPTICFGSTRGVRMGMRKTERECLELLRAEVREYRERLHRYFSQATVTHRLTAPRDAAYTSTAFNCGVGAIGRSTAVRRLNAGDIAGGCQALTWWNKAGGRVVRGLVARRTRERALCLQGLR